MGVQKKIQLLNREDIHDKKWNGCVHFAPNGMPYGYTWFLDALSENWDGIVYGDYEVVMPIVWNKKHSFYYIYQPYFTQQLGIYSLEPLNQNLVDEFISHIPEKYQLIESKVNSGNDFNFNGFKKSAKLNLILNLNHDYEVLEEKYSKSLKRNLNKAAKSELRFSTAINIEKFVQFYVEHTAKRVRKTTEKDIARIQRLVYHAQHYNMGFVNGVYSKENELVAAAFYLCNRNRMIHLLPATNPLGKKLSAMHYLTDTLIRQNAGKPKLLDFEGSEIESIAKFYRGFGAQETQYWKIERNNLPWYAKLFKS